VAKIAQAIRDGQFEVNAEAIADKLIANTRELLAPRSQH
jgi:anti-sigma28 factor (negative regulator of flagellin synthesis)